MKVLMGRSWRCDQAVLVKGSTVRCSSGVRLWRLTLHFGDFRPSLFMLHQALAASIRFWTRRTRIAPAGARSCSCRHRHNSWMHGGQGVGP